MTTEDYQKQQDASIKTQNELYLRQERQSCRKIAMEYAVKLRLQYGGELIETADLIYDFLMADIQEKSPEGL